MRFSCCSISIFALVLIFLLLSIFLWFIFPSLYKTIYISQLILAKEISGRPSSTTWMWSRPPVDTLMNFYIFNITNSDRVMFYGEKPQVVEYGPFAVSEKEEKREYEFRDEGSKLWYKNYKTYYFNESYSCPTCKYDSVIRIPNLPAIGALEDLMDPKYNVSKFNRQFISFLLLLLSEYPFINVRVGDILFDGYNDALLTLGHSDLLQGLDHLCNCSIVPIPIPEMTKMAMFFKYNNSNDEDYVIHTGKDNIEQYGKILEWAGQKELSSNLWSTPNNRILNGSDSGSFQPPGLNKSSVLPLFQSFLCRSFYTIYSEDTTVHDIPCYEFRTPYATFDTTLKENIGFRYVNNEKIDYFPNWPNCKKDESFMLQNCTFFIDCSINENLCHPCCNGSFVNGTYLLPPGMYPISCYPGRNQQPPFLMMYSAPHFAYSPKEVVDSIIGMHPVIPDHVPMIYNHEPTSSTVTKINMRFQINVPIYRNTEFILTSNVPNKIMPVFWVQTKTDFKDFVFNRIHLGFVLIPKIVDFARIFAIVLTLLFGAISVFCMRRNGTKKNTDIHEIVRLDSVTRKIS